MTENANKHLAQQKEILKDTKILMSEKLQFTLGESVTECHIKMA